MGPRQTICCKTTKAQGIKCLMADLHKSRHWQTGHRWMYASPRFRIFSVFFQSSAETCNGVTPKMPTMTGKPTHRHAGR